MLELVPAKEDARVSPWFSINNLSFKQPGNSHKLTASRHVNNNNKCIYLFVLSF